MNLSELLKIAFVSLKTNKSRAALTMLGIVIGVSSVILLISIGTGLKTYITDQLEGLGADTLMVIPGNFEIKPGGEESGGVPGAGVAASKFTFDHLNSLLRKSETLEAVMAYTQHNATVKVKGKSRITQVAGVGPEYPEVRNQEVVLGAFFSSSQYNAAKRVAVLGKTVAEDLFNEENPAGKKITIADQQYTVSGVLEEKGAFGRIDMDDQVLIPATTAMRHFDMEYIQAFWVKSKSSEMISKSKEEIEEILGLTLDDDQFSILDTKSMLNVITNILSVLTFAIAGIAAISLVVGGIGIMNIMLVSVTERIHEIGLRKAVGATPKAILVQFLAEAVILAFAGGLVGIFIGVIGSLVLRKFITAVVTFWSIALAFGVSALVGIVFGVGPAIKASKLNPIDALRYE